MSVFRIGSVVIDLSLEPTGNENEYKLTFVEKSREVTNFIFKLSNAHKPKTYAKSNLFWVLKDRGLDLKITLKKVLIAFEFHF